MGVQDLLVSFPRSDTIYLAGLFSPGRAIIRGADSPRDWDIRKGWGLGGATVVFTGSNVSKFEVDISLWQPTQWAEWQAFAKLLGKPKIPFAAPVALGIYHPILAADPINIDSVVVENVTAFEQDDEGLWTCTIKFIQYRKPTPMLGRPPLSIPAVVVATPTAQDANELKQQALIAQAKSLGGFQ